MNKKELFKFYYKFYKLIVLKDENINIKIGEKTLENRNSILLNLTSFNEILNNLMFKKGTLFYEYIENCLQNVDFNIIESLNVICDDIGKSIVDQTHLDISYQLENDLAKKTFDLIKFKFAHLELFDNCIFEQVLKDVIEKNTSKLFIIFYNSEIMSLDFSLHSNCYTFDVSDTTLISECNLICNEGVINFNVETLQNYLYDNWPIDFNANDVTAYIDRYYFYCKMKSNIFAYNDIEYLVYKLLSKLNNNMPIVLPKYVISHNVKAFLDII